MAEEMTFLDRLKATPTDKLGPSEQNFLKILCDDVEEIWKIKCKICLGRGHTHKVCPSHARLVGIGKAKNCWSSWIKRARERQLESMNS